MGCNMDYYDKMTELTNKIKIEVRELNNLAEACRLLGLNELADKLNCSTIELTNVAVDLKLTVEGDLDKQYKHSQNFSAAVLEATLVGIKVGMGKEEVHK